MGIATIKDNLAKNLAAVTGIGNVALTGTVSKTAGQTEILGTGTQFTIELRIGLVISIPGTAVEYFVVEAINSDTSLTVSQAAANSAIGQTATRYSVYTDTPDKAPERAECPAVHIEFKDDSLDASPIANALTQYRWHFQINFMLCPIGVETIGKKERDIEPYPARFVARMAGNNSLQGACTSVDFKHSFRLKGLSFLGVDYYGFMWDLNVLDDVAETYAP